MCTGWFQAFLRGVLQEEFVAGSVVLVCRHLSSSGFQRSSGKLLWMSVTSQTWNDAQGAGGLY